MRSEKFMCPLLLLDVAILFGWSNAIILDTDEQQPLSTQELQVELKSFSQTSIDPIFYPMCQGEFLDSFERSDLSPWTSALYIWGIRDTTNTYGPDTHAFSGYRYAGCPAGDVAQYLGSQTGYLFTPTIDLTDWDSLYLSFNYWSLFEGMMTNFDGGIIEISPDNGTSWLQVDSLAEGHLNPTYDSRLAGTGPLGTRWAYCYSTDPDWVSVSTQDLIGLGYVSPGDQIQIRWVFASDPAAQGEGWFVDDVRIAETSPPDLQPPIIDHTPLTDTTDTLNNYTVTAVITDDGAGVDTDSVLLHYEIEDGPILDVYMANTAGDTFEADIPSQNYHTDIWYKIMAADLAGNVAETPLYNFEVTNARTIIYDDSQPWWSSAVINPGDGSFVQFSFSDVGIDSGLLHQVKFSFDGPGRFDLRVYKGTTGIPAELIDSISGLMSPGYLWHTVDITHLDIHMRGEDPVVGYIIAAGESLGVLRDPTLDHSNRMWNFIGNSWQGGTLGDHMIRLKVIPIDVPAVKDNPGELPNRIVFDRISPNPVRRYALFEYQLPTAHNVSLNVYDASGQLVTPLVHGYEQAGTHQVSWNGEDERGNLVASGIYFLKFVVDDYTATKKLLLVR